MTSQLNKYSGNFNFLYYISVFLILLASFEYGSILYEYARFIFGYTAFAKSIILFAISIGVIAGSYLLIKVSNVKKIDLKLLVYSQVFMLFYIVVSNLIFQRFIFENTSYFSQTAFTVILLFIYGMIFGVALLLAYNFLLNNDENKTIKIYNYFFMIFFSLSVISLYNTFYFFEYSHNIQNVFLFVSIMLTISIILLILYFYLSIKKNGNNYFISNLESSKDKPVILFSYLFLISCFVSIYFYSSSRLLELVYGSGLQIKAIILSAFFLSFALGSLIFKLKQHIISNSIKALGVLGFISSVFALLALIFYGQNFHISEFLQKALDKNDYGYMYYILSSYFIILFNFFFIFFIVGAIYPAITNFAANESNNINTVGYILIFSLLGLVIGTLFTYSIGFVYFGAKYLLIFAIFINILAGLLLFLCDKDFLSKKIFLLLLFLISLFLYSVMYASGYISVESPILFKNESKQGFVNDFIFDGRNSTISIRSQKRLYSGFEPAYGVIQKIVNQSELAKNGTPLVSTEIYSENLDKDDVVSILFSAFALGLSTDAKKVLSIGLESGFSQALLLSDKNLKKIDIVEIEPGIVDATLLLGDKVKAVYEDSRSNIIIDDVIDYLRSTGQLYDIIISNYDTSYFPENGFVFTKEFYEIAKKHLYLKGILLQKIDISANNFKELGAILKALNLSFEYYNAFFADNHRLIIAASNTELPKFTEEKFNTLSFSQFLQLADINTIADLNNRFIGNQELLNILFANGVTQANSYFNKYAEVASGKNIFNDEEFKQISYINDNNLISRLTNLSNYNSDITESKYFNKTKYYKEAQNFYKGIMIDPQYLGESDFFLLLPKDKLCLNNQNKWFQVFTKASNLMINFLPENEAKNIFSKIVTGDCYSDLSNLHQYYVNYVKGLINKEYYYALSNAEKLLAGIKKSNILSNNQAAEVFKNIMLSLIKIGRPDLAKTVFEVNLKQLRIKQDSSEYVEILVLYLYALEQINHKK